MTLTEFLMARIAEDERHARAIVDALAQTDPRYGEPMWEWSGVRSIDGLPSPFRFATSHPPERVLAECEAKRRIVELAAKSEAGGYDVSGGEILLAEQVLSLLALPWSDHPDYREEWRA